MKAPADTFFVKEGYKVNSTAKTFEMSEGEYWTDARLNAVIDFQHYVYERGAQIARQHKGAVAMDLGCGPATKARNILLPAVKELFLVDQPNCESIAKKVIPSAPFYGVNLEDFTLDLGRKFDVIVCADVVEHIANPLPCLQFARQHLSPSGLALFSTPERDILRGPDCMHSPHAAHVREWNSAELKQLLEHCGFTVVEQVLLPAKRLRGAEELLWKALPIKLRRWNSCQLSICKIS